MTLEEFIVFGATLSGLVASTVETIKYSFLKTWFVRLQEKYSWDDATAHQYYVATLTVLSVAVGILVALGNGAEANILVQLGYESAHPAIGIIMTGIFLAFGDQFWHALFDLLKTLPTLSKVSAEAISQRAAPTNSVNQGWLPPETK